MLTLTIASPAPDGCTLKVPVQLRLTKPRVKVMGPFRTKGGPGVKAEAGVAATAEVARARATARAEASFMLKAPV
jgi:hypothetical protein